MNTVQIAAKRIFVLMLSVFPKSITLLGFVRKLHRRPESERFFVWQGQRSRRYWLYRRWSRTSSRRKTSRSKPDRVFRHSLPMGLQQQVLGNIVGSAGRTFKEKSGRRDCASRSAQTPAWINTLSRRHFALIRFFGVSNMLLVGNFRAIAVHPDHSNSYRPAIALRPLPAVPCFIRCPDMVDCCEQARPYRCVPILMNVARIVRVDIFAVILEEALDRSHFVCREKKLVG